MQDKLGNTVDVHLDRENRQYVICYPSEAATTVAGLADFQDRDGEEGPERIFFHTEVGEEYGGRGLASLLIRQALLDTTATGRRIVAVCPFVKSHLEKKGHNGAWRKPTRDELAEFNEDER